MAVNKQINIFGTDGKEIVTDALIFTEPASDYLRSVMEKLDKSFNKNQLWRMCQSFQSMLHSRGAVMAASVHVRRCRLSLCRALLRWSLNVPLL